MDKKPNPTAVPPPAERTNKVARVHIKLTNPDEKAESVKASKHFTVYRATIAEIEQLMRLHKIVK